MSKTRKTEQKYLYPLYTHYSTAQHSTVATQLHYHASSPSKTEQPNSKTSNASCLLRTLTD